MCSQSGRMDRMEVLNILLVCPVSESQTGLQLKCPEQGDKHLYVNEDVEMFVIRVFIQRGEAFFVTPSSNKFSQGPVILQVAYVMYCE